MKHIIYLVVLLLAFSCADKKHYRNGNALMKQKRYSEAYDSYSLYAGANPRMPRAWMVRSQAAYLAGDKLQAYKDIERTLQLDSMNVLALCNRGFLKQEMGRTAQALDDYSKALSISRKSADAYLCRASLFLSVGEKDKAAADMDAALNYGRFSPGNFACSKGLHYYYRGIARMKKREYEGAIIYFSNSIRSDSVNARAYFERGLAYRATNDKKNACADLLMARELGIAVNDSLLPLNCNR